MTKSWDFRIIFSELRETRAIAAAIAAPPQHFYHVSFLGMHIVEEPVEGHTSLERFFARGRGETYQ